MALLLAEGTPVHGIVYRGTRYDTGMPLGYLQAVVQLAAERDDLGAGVPRVAGRVRRTVRRGRGGSSDMTATADADRRPPNELTPLADYLGSVLRRLRALPPLDLDLTQAYGNVLAEDVRRARTRYPAFDQAAIDGYAARWEDIAAAPPRRTGRSGSTWSATSARRAGGRSGSPRAPASRWPPARRCRSPPTWWSRWQWTDQGMAAVEMYRAAQARATASAAPARSCRPARCWPAPART